MNNKGKVVENNFLYLFLSLRDKRERKGDNTLRSDSQLG